MRKKQWTRDEVIRTCIERPIWAYFHFGMGLAYEAKKNLRDLMSGIEDMLDALCYIGLCLFQGFLHLAQFVFYPFTKAVSLMRTRERVRDRYDRIIEADKTAEKNENVCGFGG